MITVTSIQSSTYKTYDMFKHNIKPSYFKVESLSQIFKFQFAFKDSFPNLSAYISTSIYNDGFSLAATMGFHLVRIKNSTIFSERVIIS